MKKTEEQLKKIMTSLVQECYAEDADFKNIIAKAVTLGMSYQEEKIKEGMDIVFDELHKKR